MERNNKIVLGFDIYEYDRRTLEMANDHRKHEMALEDEENTRIWDNLDDFFNDLNDDQVDTENMYYFAVDL